MYTVFEKFPLLLLSALLLMVTFPTLYAASFNDSGDSAWYVEAAVSRVDVSHNQGQFLLDDDKTGWSLSLGYAFNRYFSVQAGYHSFGRNYLTDDCPAPQQCIVINTEEADIDGLSIAGVVSWPISDVFDVFGTVGVISWDTNFRQGNRDESGEDLMYGAGIGANLTPHWRMVLKYERFDFDADTASLGIAYRF